MDELLTGKRCDIDQKLFDAVTSAPDGANSTVSIGNEIFNRPFTEADRTVDRLDAEDRE